GGGFGRGGILGDQGTAHGRDVQFDLVERRFELGRVRRGLVQAVRKRGGGGRRVGRAAGGRHGGRGGRGGLAGRARSAWGVLVSLPSLMACAMRSTLAASNVGSPSLRALAVADRSTWVLDSAEDAPGAWPLRWVSPVLRSLLPTAVGAAVLLIWPIFMTLS